jgi:hypothetical protein
MNNKKRLTGIPSRGEIKKTKPDFKENDMDPS